MAGMGPPPKPEGQRRRRNVVPGTIRLPAAGRTGRAPAWPLPADLEGKRHLAKLADLEATVLGRLDVEDDDEKRETLQRRLAAIARQVEILEERITVTEGLEAELWRALWRTPQAVEWARLRWTRTVAQYVRWKAQAELGDLKAGAEARQYEDRLGLNSLAMLRLRWVVEDTAPAQAKPKATVTAMSDYRRDLSGA